MEIILYNTLSENNRLEKVLSNPTTLNGSFKGSVDLLEPVIQISANVLSFNYCFIPSISRYFFIKKIELTRKNLYTLFLEIDVLQTYKEEIKELQVILNGSKGKPYFERYISSLDIRKDTTILEFENNFNETGVNILVSVNGKTR